MTSQEPDAPPEPGSVAPADEPPYRQLRMLWPTALRPASALMHAPRGYQLRGGADDDTEAFLRLMTRVELGTWDVEKVLHWTTTVVPGGWTVVVHEASDQLVATCMGHRRPIKDLYPEGYEVGWIAASPDHAGHGLGRIITAVATARLLDVGARCIYLQTDDFRLPALKSYLEVGFVPHLWAEGMLERWRTICTQLKVPFTPKGWPGYRSVGQ